MIDNHFENANLEIFNFKLRLIEVILILLIFVASNGKVGNKGLAEEGKQQIYGRLPTESQVPSHGYNAVPSEKLPSSEEEINPLYVNETWQKATTKRPTTSKERSTSTTGKLITTKEREPSASLKTVS